MVLILTAVDVAGLAAAGQREVVLAPGDLATSEAVDRARALGIVIDRRGSALPPAATPVPPSAASVTAALNSRISREVDAVVEASPGVPLPELIDVVMTRLTGGASRRHELADDRTGGASTATVTARLAEFVVTWAKRGLPSELVHESKRLLLNNLKSSVQAPDHDIVLTILDLTQTLGPGADLAHVLWHGGRVVPDDAALINSIQMEVFDFNETHVPTYVHLSPAVLPAVLAVGEHLGASGRAVLEAVAIGIEVNLAVATMLMPAMYERGFLSGVVAGSVGAAAGCAAVAGLDRDRTQNAIAIAMLSAGGLFEAVGSQTLPFLMGNASRNGVVACRLAANGVDSSATAFEGEKGMLRGFGDFDLDKVGAVTDNLGQVWRMQHGSYKRYQAETIDQAPLQALFELREGLSRERVDQVASMRFLVCPLVADIAHERYTRFGRPSSHLQATFDLRYVMAAAWTLGRIGGDTYAPIHYMDARILDLRDRIAVEGDPELELDAASLEVVFTDSERHTVRVDRFTGSPEVPLTDADLETLFREQAQGRVSPPAVDRILRGLWDLDRTPDVRSFVALIVDDHLGRALA